MEKVKIIKKCRACNSENLIPIISLGEQYVSNFVESEEEQGIKVPLELILCEDCKLLQLKHNAPPELMWGNQYWYKSGISSTIKNDLKDIVDKAQQLKEIKKGDILIDIGCNDGTMLEFYDKEGVEFAPKDEWRYVPQAEFFNIIGENFNRNPKYYMRTLYKGIKKKMRKLNGRDTLKEMEKYLIETYCLYPGEKILFECNIKLLLYFCWP